MLQGELTNIVCYCTFARDGIITQLIDLWNGKSWRWYDLKMSGKEKKETVYHEDNR